MLSVALKMLVGDKTKFFGIIFGIAFSSFLICQQSAIFLGLVERSYRLLIDIPTPEIWVMDPGSESTDKILELPESQIDRVKSVPGVLWASPLAMNYLPIKLSNGFFHIAQIVAVDENTLIGAPQKMIQGKAENLRIPDGVILDQHAINVELINSNNKEQSIPLKLGDEFEAFNQHVILVGIADLTLGFYPQPIMYLGYDLYKKLLNYKQRHLQIILVRTQPGANVEEVIQRIKNQTGLAAYTREGFKWRSLWYFLKSGILINFGTTVISGILLGLAIVGIMFHMLTMDYLPYFAMLRAIGTTPKKIAQMIYFQALIAGLIGLGIGTGLAAITGYFIISWKGSVAFLFPPLVLLIATLGVVLICLLSAWLCIRRVLSQDPKTVMESR